MCTAAVRGILGKVPGVESAEVDFDSKTATVKYKGALPAETLTSAINKTRFKAKVKQ